MQTINTHASVQTPPRINAIKGSNPTGGSPYVYKNQIVKIISHDITVIGREGCVLRTPFHLAESYAEPSIT